MFIITASTTAETQFTVAWLVLVRLTTQAKDTEAHVPNVSLTILCYALASMFRYVIYK
jgi:hypothetical protein